MRFLALFFAILHPIFAMHWPSKDPALGVKTLHYFDQKRERPVIVEFWYPAERKGLIEKLESTALLFQPEQYRNAPLIKPETKYPLILISHGHQGDRCDLSWLAEQLVCRGGFVVAAIDHFGDQRKNFIMERSIRFWDRPLDFTFLLNQLENDKDFFAKIDFHKIGFVGYSLGGMTGLGLAGAQASNLRELLPRLRKELPQWPDQIFEEFDYTVSEYSFFEPRIQGVVLLCPATFPYSSHSLKKVKTPVGLVITVGDEILPYNDHASRLIRYLVPKKLKVLGEEVSHSIFLNRPTELGKKIWSKAATLFDRTPIHEEVGAFTIEFFHEILNSSKLSPKH